MHSLSKTVACTFLQKDPSSLAPRNQLFEKMAFQILTNALEQKIKKQTSPWVSPPLIARVLQSSPLRIKSKMLESSLPAKNHCRWPSPSHRDAPLGGEETLSSRNFFCTPQSPPTLQDIAGGQPLSAPPWPGRGGSSKHQPHQRRAKYRLLKKASPDPP
jgi:hypothetical protein